MCVHMCVYLFCYMVIKLFSKSLFGEGVGIEGKEVVLNDKPISN